MSAMMGVLGGVGVLVAGAVGLSARRNAQAQKAREDEARTKKETEEALVSLLSSLRELERSPAGVVKELHPLDKLAKGAALGEKRGLISIDFVKGKMFVRLTKAGKTSSEDQRPTSTPMPLE